MLASTFLGSTALRKGPRRFWPHCWDPLHALMLMCQNSPQWRSCENCNTFLSSLWLPFLFWVEQHGRHMTWEVASLRAALSTCWWMQTESAQGAATRSVVTTRCNSEKKKLTLSHSYWLHWLTLSHNPPFIHLHYKLIWHCNGKEAGKAVVLCV